MFNPEQHLSDIKGKEYLEVKWRLVWFRDEHPTGSIDTQLVSIQGDTIIVRAAVIDGNGVLLGSGHGMADASIAKMAQGRIIEKAETAAIGRALAHAGYGTQFTGEEEGDFLADSPVVRQPAPTGQIPAKLLTEQSRAVYMSEMSDVQVDFIASSLKTWLGLDGQGPHFDNRLKKRMNTDLAGLFSLHKPWGEVWDTLSAPSEG